MLLAIFAALPSEQDEIASNANVSRTSAGIQ